MDAYEEISERANRLALAVARHEAMKKLGEVTPRPSDEEFSKAMFDVTSLFKNVTKYLAGDPQTPSPESVAAMTSSYLRRAHEEVEGSMAVRPSRLRS